ncbi:MAG: sulfide/dihydroorotate dehydrogenase-like FAD/NAD-binding protein [Planctomycetes bacterium]|nr:sulfide/dihydroorotate dehydrogenase-like FAD/NAD-binding protein [Planctomycetota bacterium]
MAKILEKEMIAPNVHEVVVYAPDVAAKAKPGQFVIVIADEFSERIPLTISDINPGAETISFIFLEIGASTLRLAELQKGEEIFSFTGPLGRPFEIDNVGEVALVGGCYGIGGIFPAIEAFKNAGNKVTVFLEARAGFLLYWQDKIEAAADKVIYSTGDGSVGNKGHSHDALKQLLDSGVKYDLVIGVGCTFMMYKISEATKPFNIKTIVSMNSVMIDGTGMCGACRLAVDGKTKFACVDGPHFDGHKIDWDIVLARRKAYLNEEIISHERW